MEISKCEKDNDESGLKRWKNEIANCKEETLSVNNRIIEVEMNKADIEQELNIQISHIEAKFIASEENVALTSKKIQSNNEIKLDLFEKRINVLRENTSLLLENIKNLSNKRKESITILDNLGIPIRKRNLVLVYIPFFLVCYRQEFKRRYIMFPPSFVHGMRGITKLKGVFKASKVTVVLDDRSESITRYLNLFLQLIGKNQIFEEKVFKAGEKVNILGTIKKKNNIVKGLKMLHKEGWLSDSDFKYYEEKII
jgi:hypothetical protein